MPKVNTKIYYNNTNGEILLVLNQNEGPFVQESSFEKDIVTFDALKGINRNVISVLKLAWDQYKEDFITQQAVKVVAGEIKWQPFNPAPSQPPDKPFSERLKDMERKNQMLQLQNQAQTTQYQFLEDVVTELILTTMP